MDSTYATTTCANKMVSHPLFETEIKKQTNVLSNPAVCATKSTKKMLMPYGQALSGTDNKSNKSTTMIT